MLEKIGLIDCWLFLITWGENPGRRGVSVATRWGEWKSSFKTERLDQIQLIPQWILNELPDPGKHDEGFAVESCQGESKDEDSTLQARFG